MRRQSIQAAGAVSPAPAWLTSAIGRVSSRSSFSIVCNTRDSKLSSVSQIGRCVSWILAQPSFRMVRVALFDRVPGQAFPCAKVDLAQPWKHTVERHERLRAWLRSHARAQIAGIHHLNPILREVSPGRQLAVAPSAIEWWIGVPAEGPSQCGGAMADKKQIAHAAHTPQRYTAISVSWLVVPKQSPVTPPRRRRKNMPQPAVTAGTRRSGAIAARFSTSTVTSALKSEPATRADPEVSCAMREPCPASVLSCACSG